MSFGGNVRAIELKNASKGECQITTELPLFSYPCDFPSFLFFLGEIVFQYFGGGGEGVPTFILQLCAVFTIIHFDVT